jgi:hypothetical protein
LLLFNAEKKGQARQLAADMKLQVAPDIWTFFTAASSGDLAEGKGFEILRSGWTGTTPLGAEPFLRSRGLHPRLFVF